MISAADWSGLNARARGLASHLLGRQALDGLIGSTSLSALARVLIDRGAIEELDAANAASLERALRRAAHHAWSKLTPWAPSVVFDVFFADRDRRTIRALLRGALQEASQQTRLAAAFPTPRLPERALEVLAGRSSPQQVVEELLLLSHPDAAALMLSARSKRPDLFELEAALSRSSLERARSAARCDRVLRRFVAERIDQTNQQNAVLLAGTKDVAPEAIFIDGGLALKLETFLEIASLDREAALSRFDERDLPRMERRALSASIERTHKALRLDPIGAAQTLFFLLRLEAQTIDLSRIVWGVALGVPPPLLRAELVTP